MSLILVVLVVMPFAAAAICYTLPAAASKGLSIAAGVATFVLAILLVPAVVDHRSVSAGGELRVDALSVVFLVATAFLYMATAIFSAGYLHLAPGADGRRYARRFYAGLNLFCWAMVVAPLVNGFALLWVAVEITTVVSALLVAIDDTDGSTEAAWKYVLIASMGLGIALLSTVVLYYAGTSTLGAGFSMTFAQMDAAAAHFPPSIVRLAFVLAVLGFGTKMGLVPMHTWLPDAHSEAPTPISALLSGALLATSFYAILRFYQVAVHSLGSEFARNVLLVFGVASLLLAALYLVKQRDMKRMLAYSSIEHMGILAIGMSFGVTLAIVGVLLHVLAHAAAKGTAFFGAGSVLAKFKTKDMGVVRGGVSVLPWSGSMLVAAVLALSAMPPFGLFRSEFLIVAGGLSDPRYAVAAVLIVLVTLAFLGISWSMSETMLTPLASVPVTSGAVGTQDASSTSPGTAGMPVTKGEVSPAIVIAMVLGIVALVVLGVHLPSQLAALVNHAARELEAPR